MAHAAGREILLLSEVDEWYLALDEGTAGDKQGTCNAWYLKAIPLADDRYDEWKGEGP